MTEQTTISDSPVPQMPYEDVWEDAEEMEALEIEILAKLGFENPYLEQD